MRTDAGRYGCRVRRVERVALGCHCDMPLHPRTIQALHVSGPSKTMGRMGLTLAAQRLIVRGGHGYVAARRYRGLFARELRRRTRKRRNDLDVSQCGASESATGRHDNTLYPYPVHEWRYSIEKLGQDAVSACGRLLVIY